VPPLNSLKPHPVPREPRPSDLKGAGFREAPQETFIQEGRAPATILDTLIGIAGFAQQSEKGEFITLLSGAAAWPLAARGPDHYAPIGRAPCDALSPRMLRIIGELAEHSRRVDDIEGVWSSMCWSICSA
jgi:hypothetical protein